MDTLQRNGYDLAKAMSTLVPQGGPVLCRDEMEEWSASEAMLFEEALEKYGKDFNDIRQDFVSVATSRVESRAWQGSLLFLDNLALPWASWELRGRTSRFRCWCPFSEMDVLWAAGVCFRRADLDRPKVCMLLTICVPCSCRGNPWPASCSSTTCGKLQTDTSSRWVGPFLAVNRGEVAG